MDPTSLTDRAAPWLTALDEAMSALDAAAQARTAVVRVGLRLRLDDYDGLLALEWLPDDASRRGALAFRVDLGCAPSVELGQRTCALVPPTLEPHDVGLLLWAGSSDEAAGLNALLPTERARAVELSLSGGVPETLEAAERFLDARTETLGRDMSRLALVRRRGDSLEALTETALRVADPVARLYALAELASRGRDAPEPLRERWIAAAEDAVGEVTDPIVPGEPHALLALISAGTDDHAAQRAFRQSMTLLPNDRDQYGRVRHDRMLLVAAARLSLPVWREVVRSITDDRTLVPSAVTRGEVAYVISDSVRHLRAPSDRSTALTVCAELLRWRIPPVSRAAIVARLAEESASIPGRAATSWLAELPKHLREVRPDRDAVAVLPTVGRHLMRCAPDAILGNLSALPQPGLRVLLLTGAIDQLAVSRLSVVGA